MSSADPEKTRHLRNDSTRVLDEGRTIVRSADVTIMIRGEGTASSSSSKTHSTMDATFLCYNCMHQLTDKNGKCKRCGWNNSVRENEAGYLPEVVLDQRWYIGHKIGRGGFGATYIGWDLRIGRKIAVKEYFPSQMSYRDMGNGMMIRSNMSNSIEFSHGIGKAKQEAGFVAELDSIPNVVRLYDTLEANGTFYLVMEYVEGRTLKSIIEDQNTGMTYKQSMQYMRPIMEALGRIHVKNIIHRDISPDNIMIREGSGEPVLLDFGAACSDYTSELTGELIATVKPGYSAPEQYSANARLDGRADEYAVCATVYYLLTGKKLQPSVDRTLNDNLKGIPGLKDKGRERVLLKGLSVHKEDRYQTMEELLRALDHPNPLPLPLLLGLGGAAAVAVVLIILLTKGGDTVPALEPDKVINAEETAVVLPTEEPVVTEEPAPSPTSVVPADAAIICTRDGDMARIDWSSLGGTQYDVTISVDGEKDTVRTGTVSSYAERSLPEGTTGTITVKAYYTDGSTKEFTGDLK